MIDLSSPEPPRRLLPPPPEPPRRLPPDYAYDPPSEGFDARKFWRVLGVTSAIFACGESWIVTMLLLGKLLPDSVFGGLIFGTFLVLTFIVPFAAITAGWRPPIEKWIG